MTRRLQQQDGFEVTSDETNVIALESRREKAEAEFLILASDIKRLSKEIDDSADIIQNNKLVKEDLFDTIQSLKTDIVTLKKAASSSRNKSTQELNDIEVKKESVVASIEVLRGKNDYLVARNEDLSNTSIKIQSEMDVSIRKSENILVSLASDTDRLRERKSVATQSLAALETSSNDLREKIETLNKERFRIENASLSLKSYSEELSSSVDNAKSSILQLGKVIVDKSEEVARIVLLIQTTKMEYDSLKKDVFAVGDRREALDSRELFIRNRYEQAGIKWE